MPTFDFQCRKCQHTFEFSRPFTSREHPACPECKSKKTEKLISAPTFMLRGQGFYKTDSTKKSAKKPVEGKTVPEKKEAGTKEVEKKETLKETEGKKSTTQEKKN